MCSLHAFLYSLVRKANLFLFTVKVSNVALALAKLQAIINSLQGMEIEIMERDD